MHISYLNTLLNQIKFFNKHCCVFHVKRRLKTNQEWIQKLSVCRSKLKHETK